MTKLMPVARTRELIVQEVENEYLVYDLNTDKALCLNSVSAEIWELCDGIRSVQEVSGIIGKKMGIQIDEDYIWLAINELEKNKLLEGKVCRPSEFENVSRRNVLFKYAVPTLILPIIASIVAPKAVSAQSSGMACPPVTFPCSPDAIPTGCPCSVTGCSNCVGICDGSMSPAVCI